MGDQRLSTQLSTRVRPWANQMVSHSENRLGVWVRPHPSVLVARPPACVPGGGACRWPLVYSHLERLRGKRRKEDKRTGASDSAPEPPLLQVVLRPALLMQS